LIPFLPWKVIKSLLPCLLLWLWWLLSYPAHWLKPIELCHFWWPERGDHPIKSPLKGLGGCIFIFYFKRDQTFLQTWWHFFRHKTQALGLLSLIRWGYQ
jgi:hypothetical protein